MVGDYFPMGDPVTRFPLPAAPALLPHEKARNVTPKWVDIPPGEIKHELIRRNGRFHSMLNFLRHLPACAAVLDISGRLIFLNEPLAYYWKVHAWDLLGQQLCQVMHLTEEETARNRQERERTLREQHPTAYNEHFHNGGQLISMCCVPFPDDNDDMLLFALILPHSLDRK
jgi:hypothetical protein